MKINVESVYQQGSGVVNEDELLIADPLFAVFDGVSSLVPAPAPVAKSGGYQAANAAKRVFASARKSLIDLTIEANQKIQQAMEQAGLKHPQKEERWATCLAAVRVSPNLIDLIRVGDCVILALYTDGSYVLPASYHDHDLETMIMCKKFGQKHEQNIWNKLLPQTLTVRRRANIDYGVLNGEPEVVKHINQGRLSLKGISDLLLFTDGLLIPQKDPRKPEDWKHLVNLYKKGGLMAVADYIRRKEREDPNLWEYPRFKLHDDIAAMAIKFSVR